MTGIQTCRHRLNALPLARQQQTLAIILQRSVSVFVPRGGRQALNIGREALLLWAWRRESCAHKTILHQNVYFCDPVVLAARGNNRVGRVASAAGARARSSDDSNAGHFRGAATELLPGAAATLWAARIWPDSVVARCRRWARIDSSSRLALGPNRGCAIPRDYYHGLLGFRTIIGR